MMASRHILLEVELRVSESKVCGRMIEDDPGATVASTRSGA